MKYSSGSEAKCFLSFGQSISEFSLPERFTFPFYYEPHPICLLAAKEIQLHLQTQTEWEHNFGLIDGQLGLVIGKMFGVLVVQNKLGEIGYLAAFSGKLAGSYHHSKFVPPLFDLLEQDGFFLREEKVINEINAQIVALEKDPEWLACKEQLEAEKQHAQMALTQRKEEMKAAKQQRNINRQEAAAKLSAEELESLLEELKRESQAAHFALKDFSRQLKKQVEAAEQKTLVFEQKMIFLKEERKRKAAALQEKLFDQYHFLNRDKELKSLNEIFAHTAENKPPAGSGECAAPKLLQYAFEHDLKPIAMAEFWWGQSPVSEVRKHGFFYPACRGKCEPILAHMLAGIDMDENPMLTNTALGKTLETVFEDEYLLLINKPSEFLSVPGKNIQDSVYERLKLQYPLATGPLLVHRLDMSTSGLLLIAKTKEVHKDLQRQFIKRSIKKTYIALLEGLIMEDEGIIDLPLRVDLDDRPHQLVCYEYGKPAQTKWKVLERTAKQTKIRFFPITGRTHQLRVHAAHPLGLNTPIVGDDLYGTKANRLHLHAESIEFKHPVTKELMKISLDPEF